MLLDPPFPSFVSNEELKATPQGQRHLLEVGEGEGSWGLGAGGMHSGPQLGETGAHGPGELWEGFGQVGCKHLPAGLSRRHLDVYLKLGPPGGSEASASRSP